MVLQYQHLLEQYGPENAQVSMTSTLNIFKFHSKSFRQQAKDQILEAIKSQKEEKQKLESTLVKDKTILGRFKPNRIQEELGFYGSKAA